MDSTGAASTSHMSHVIDAILVLTFAVVVFITCTLLKRLYRVVNSVLKLELKLTCNIDVHGIVLADYLRVSYKGSRGTLQSKFVTRPRGCQGQLHCNALLPTLFLICFFTFCCHSDVSTCSF